MSYEITVDAWIRSLPVSQSFKNTILYPWITSLIGTTRANALISSARSTLQTFALAFPSNIFAGATTYNSQIGLQGNLQKLLDRIPGVNVFVNAPAPGLTGPVFSPCAGPLRAGPPQLWARLRCRQPPRTRATIHAARRLRPLQRRRGRYSSGQYPTGMALREAAVYSAMKVAAAVAR